MVKFNVPYTWLYLPTHFTNIMMFLISNAPMPCPHMSACHWPSLEVIVDWLSVLSNYLCWETVRWVGENDRVHFLLTYCVFISAYKYKLDHVQNVILTKNGENIKPKVCYTEIVFNKQVWNVDLHLKCDYKYLSLKVQKQEPIEKMK